MIAPCPGLCNVAEALALERYESFDAARREAERLVADATDLAALEGLGRDLEARERGKQE